MVLNGKNEISFASALAGGGLLALSFFYGHIFAYPFLTAKWIAFYGCSFLALAHLISWRSFSVPKLPGVLWAAFGIMILCMVVLINQRTPIAFEAAVTDRIGFLVLVLFFFSAFESGKLEWKDFFFPAWIAILGISLIGIAQTFHVRLDHADMPFFEIGSTVGHTSAAGQWVVALFCLVIPFFGHLDGKRARWSTLLVVLLGVFYLFVTRARSSWIFFGVGAAFLTWWHRDILWSKWKKQIFGFAAVCFLMLVGVVLAAGKNFLAGKGSMIVYRAELWAATMKMIFDNPFGYGVGQFQFAHLPYIKGTPIVSYQFLARSPHNEFLRYLAEDGVFVSILLVVLLGTVVIRFLKSASVSREEKSVSGLLLLFFAWEGMFQHVFLLAQTVYLFAILLGYMLAKTFPPRSFSQQNFRPILTVVAVLLLFFSGRVSYSHFNEHSNDYESVSRACEWFPGNFSACFRKGGMEYGANDLAAARRTYEGLLEVSPYNYKALRYLSAVVFREGKSRDKLIEGCFYLWRHNDLFGEKSPLNQYQQKRCPQKILNYFETRRPEKFLGRQL